MSDGVSSSSAAPTASAPEFSPIAPEQYPPSQLSDPNFSVSASNARPFAGNTGFTAEKDLDAAMAAAKLVLPEAQCAYKPSGKTTVSALVAMLLASPVVLILLLLLCGGLAYGWDWLLAQGSAKPSSGTPRGAGLISLILDFILVFLMVYVPAVMYGSISRFLKNRNPKSPVWLAVRTTFLVAMALFAPVWSG